MPEPEGRMSRRSFIAGAAQAGVVVTAASAGAEMPGHGLAPTRIVSLDGEWRLSIDPKDEGRTAGWFGGPLANAVATRVPWIIQEAFPGYHGVAWYQREITPPVNAHRAGRCLLRFWAVDYKADVWLNGRYLGTHEGQDAPFEFDVTGVSKPGVANLLTVRVLNPTNEPIDGMTLKQTPRRAKEIPYRAGGSYNSGGIVDSVELILAPAAYLGDVHVRPDVHTGAIHVAVNVRNGAKRAVKGILSLCVGPAIGGEAIDLVEVACTLPAGDTALSADLHVEHPRLWDLADPFLYRVTARLTLGGSCDERAVRCGFRDFRFENGYFRLNGRRIFLRGSHTVNSTPVGQHITNDPTLFQRDVLMMKTMGFNCIRFIWGGSTRRQLDLCDEMGLMVYQESAASNPMEDSPLMAERFDRAQSELMQRDRNHPSVVIWGLLNETQDGPVFHHAVGMLPLVRALDQDRMVMLNSGRWDGYLEIGSLCNPGSSTWETLLGAEGPGAGKTSWGVIRRLLQSHGRRARLPAGTSAAVGYAFSAQSRARYEAGLPERARDRQRGGLMAHRAHLRADRQGGDRGRAVLPRPAGSVPCGLAAMASRRRLRDARRLLRAEHPPIRRAAHAEYGCAAFESEDGRIQPDGDDGPGELRRGSIHAVPRAQAGNYRRALRGAGAIAAVRTAVARARLRGSEGARGSVARERGCAATR